MNFLVAHYEFIGNSATAIIVYSRARSRHGLDPLNAALWACAVILGQYLLFSLPIAALSESNGFFQ